MEDSAKVAHEILLTPLKEGIIANIVVIETAAHATRDFSYLHLLEQ